MSAFNTVAAKLNCPQCSAAVEVSVQFKYGNTWQHHYALGEALRWGGNDIGDREARHVVIDGVAEGKCPHCGWDGERNLYVFVRNGFLERVAPADRSIDFAKLPNSYLVLDESQVHTPLIDP